MQHVVGRLVHGGGVMEPDNRRSPVEDAQRLDRIRKFFVLTGQVWESETQFLLDHINTLTTELGDLSTRYAELSSTASNKLAELMAERDTLLTVVQHLRIMSALGLPLSDSSPSLVGGDE